MITLLILAGLGVFSLVGAIFNLRRSLEVVVITGLLASLTVSLFYSNESEYLFRNMLFLDHYAHLFSALLCFVGICWFLGFGGGLKNDFHRIEKFNLVLFSMVGGFFMITFNHLIILFLGIEILSIPLYALAASQQNNNLSIEAGLKYFLMGSFASAFLLLGVALIYGSAGTFQLNLIGEYVSTGQSSFPGLFHLGISLMVLGFFFKISVVPFHFWTPDVYEGSPTVVTAYMSGMVKIAAFAGFSRLLIISSTGIQGQHQLILLICCVLTLLIGNLMAIYPDSAKRMLAYSSIAQAGYLLIPLLGNPSESQPILFYGLTVYAVALMSLFIIIHALEEIHGPVQIHHFDGLGPKNPFLAAVVSISLISLAGIPPLAGFMSKYLIFSQAISEGYLPLIIFSVFTSLIGVYYYFRIIVAMFFKPAPPQPSLIPLEPMIYTGILSFLLILLGLFPDLLFSL